MYIKQVRIEGFKSYREEVATDPFSPKVNCVVGANGSGKTNFFHGAGYQVSSAFVEIVFDNSDNRIPVDKKEVCLRRTITVKKDDYFFDGKRITKTEVMNLLESAGFSRSNPYYVVGKEQIASLTLMKDSERLDLLKDIGGTRVYEERRRESLKIMLETGNKRKDIIYYVQCLDEKLKELDEMREELREYQMLDKQRKSLEFTIYDKELHDARRELSEVEEARARVSETSARMYDSVVDAHEKSKDLDKVMRDLTKEVQALSKEKEVAEGQRTEAIKKHTELELDVRDIEEKISRNIRARDDAVKHLQILKREILESDLELDQISDLYETQLHKENEITKGIIEREKQLGILYQKQGRATQFANKAARDEWLQKEIKDLNVVLSSNLEQERKLKDKIDRLNSELQEQNSYITKHDKEIAALESFIKEAHERAGGQRSRRDKLQDERKSLWRKESELTSEIDKLSTEVENAQRKLDHATPGDVRRGLNSVPKILDEYKIEGVCRPIIELFHCDEKYFTAVEVSAGNSLFHVVVKDDKTSTTIIKQLNSSKGGRLTFIPLDTVTAPCVELPNPIDPDVVTPLVEKLKFSSAYTAAFKQVFARTVICPDLDVAKRVARTHMLDCITLEGDQVCKNGGITGGFHDHRRSRLKFRNIIVRNKQSVEAKKGERETVRLKLQEIDQKITEFLTDQQKTDAKRSHDKSELEQFKKDIANADKQKRLILKALKNKEKSESDVRTQVEQLRASVAVKEAEMGTELIDHLTPEERVLLSRLNPEIAELKENLITRKADRIETETRKAELETNLTANLKRRQQELEGIISNTETDGSLGEVEIKRRELRDAKSLVEEATKQLTSVSLSIDGRTKQLKKIKDEKTKLKNLEDNYERTLQEEAKDMEQLLSKRSMLLAKQEEFSRRIRELGPLSSGAFETYKRKSLKELHKMLHMCNEQLQQFSRANKIVIPDQYVNFTELREELQKRQAELDAGDEKIKELISTLDQRKDESIERTFKGVARHFREVFSELVQGGHGHLVMMKKKDGDHVDDANDDDEPHEADAEGRVEKYIGVKVKVSFTGQGETKSMKQLSGGQKTIVALTLIFAIQRCDPAPFYLFDEIDAALDSQYRTSVGNMIRRLADMASTQFITTTFRPELVKVADKIYGVTHKNRVSSVNVVSQDKAIGFIEEDQSHNTD